MRRLRVSDHLDEIDDEFDGTVVTFYKDRDQPAGRLERLRADDNMRRSLGATGRALVLARHTFAHWVKELLRSSSPCSPLIRRGLAALVRQATGPRPPALEEKTASRLRVDGQDADAETDPGSNRAGRLADRRSA